MEAGGIILRLPFNVTVPIPWSTETSAASLTAHRNSAEPPAAIMSGSAVNTWITGRFGAGCRCSAFGGGGGGGAGAFFLQPEAGVGIEIDASCFSEFSISLTASAAPTLRADPLQLALTT
jgi:hypothetical protein